MEIMAYHCSLYDSIGLAHITYCSDVALDSLVVTFIRTSPPDSSGSRNI